MPARISGLRVTDVRFPTSRTLDGSDAMNPDPDYSAAYAVLECDDGRTGQAFAFTIGRGNDVQVAAIRALAPLVLGRDVDTLVADLGEFSRALVHDSQLRWLGPEKGVMHMAIGAVVNAAFDLAARTSGEPLWAHLAGLDPDALVDLVDFRYLSDALPPDRARELLAAAVPGRADRAAALRRDGYSAYTTTPGWLGYTDEKMTRLIQEAVADGFDQIKLKVGADLNEDKRRLALARDVGGPGLRIAVDANQRWDVGAAIDWIGALAPWSPHWVEEPTSPDDVVGHAAIRRAVAPVPIATGEHVQNRIVFKQLLQLDAVDVVQLDAARVGGVGENLAILLLAAAFDVPVCPHAGGVGLCEMVRHLSMFDFVALTGTTEHRSIEWVDHLHEHFADPATVHNGRYAAPEQPGFSTLLHPESVAKYRFPDGAGWAER